MSARERSRSLPNECFGSALGVLLECSESFMRALRVHLGLYLIFQANLADCMRYSFRNGGLPRRQIWIWRAALIGHAGSFLDFLRFFQIFARFRRKTPHIKYMGKRFFVIFLDFSRFF